MEVDYSSMKYVSSSDIHKVMIHVHSFFFWGGGGGGGGISVSFQSVMWILIYSLYTMQ